MLPFSVSSLLGTADDNAGASPPDDTPLSLSTSTSVLTSTPVTGGLCIGSVGELDSSPPSPRSRGRRREMMVPVTVYCFEGMWRMAR
jgi:hypothetical protein